MFMFDKKRDMSSIMSSRKKDDMEFGPAKMKNENSKDEDGMMDGRHMAAQDMIAAHSEGSADKMREAMINFIDLHMAAKNEEKEDEASGAPESEASDELSY